MTEARKTLEKFFQKSIFLEVFVKVDKDWRQSDRAWSTVIDKIELWGRSCPMFGALGRLFEE